MKIKYETSAGGIVYKKEDGKTWWLIIQHAGKGHWGFPKGHVGDKIENEAMEEAALREVKEEGGIKARIIQDTPATTHYSFRAGDILIKKTVHYFLMEYISGDIQNHDHEISDIQWANKEEVLQKVTYESDKKAFEKLRFLCIPNNMKVSIGAVEGI